MKNNSITAHMIVKNDDQWVWYAINSVLPFVDRFLIIDTGSSDKTIEYIQSIKDNKIEFEKIPVSNPTELVYLRNRQLSQTRTTWLWMVDADEIYPQKTAMEIIKSLDYKYAGVIVPRLDCLGDIYHYQPDESVGSYSLPGVIGHYNLRLINCTIPGLHISGSYPNEGFVDQDSLPLVNYSPDKFYVTKFRYFHTTYLNRSSLGKNLNQTLHRKKYKIELGKPVPALDIPEIFNEKVPKNIPIPARRSLPYVLIAALMTPAKILKRRLLK